MKPEIASLEWETPPDWIEEKGSGLRLAFFTVPSLESRLICTLVVLKGDGGGIKANVRRWLDQLNISLDSETDANHFISRQKKFRTSGGFPAILIDFTPLNAKSEAISMLVSMVNLPMETVFIKMMDKKSRLTEKRADLFALSKSLKMGFKDDFASQ